MGKVLYYIEELYIKFIDVIFCSNAEQLEEERNVRKFVLRWLVSLKTKTIKNMNKLQEQEQDPDSRCTTR